jgi:hypothetical protein
MSYNVYNTLGPTGNEVPVYTINTLDSTGNNSIISLEEGTIVYTA